MLDVRATQLRDAEAIEDQQANHRLGLMAARGGGLQQRAHLLVADRASAAARDELEG